MCFELALKRIQAVCFTSW